MKTTCSECGKEFSFGTLGRCPGCEGILQPVYSDQSVLGLKDVRRGEGIDRYRSLMPVSNPIPFLARGVQSLGCVQRSRGITRRSPRS